jgi:hypothetical protein
MPIRYVAFPFPVAGQPKSVHKSYVEGKDLLSGKPMMQAVVDAFTKPLTDDEKKKLKAYVDGGGTIFAQACCSRKDFADSFRALVKELFTGDLQPLPEAHRIFERMKTKGAAPRPDVEYLALDKEQGRPAVLFLPHDSCCRWHQGGSDSRASYAIGTGIYFYVTIEGRKMFQRTHPETVPTTPEVPEPVLVPEPPAPNPETPPLTPKPAEKPPPAPGVPPEEN